MKKKNKTVLTKSPLRQTAHDRHQHRVYMCYNQSIKFYRTINSHLFINNRWRPRSAPRFNLPSANKNGSLSL